MSVHTKLLATGDTIAVGLTTVYTTPAGHTAILKDIRLYSYGPVATTLEVLIMSPSGQGGRIYSKSIANAEIAFASLWVVVPSGWRLQVNNTAVATVLYWLSGTELIGEPPTPTVPTFRVDDPIAGPQTKT